MSEWDNWVADAVGRINQSQTIQKALLAGTTALGVGVGFRGLQGVGQILAGPPKNPSVSATRISLPLGKEEEEEDKTASGDESWLERFIAGRTTSPNTIGVPWAIPAIGGLATAGVLGGWKLTDAVMDSRHKARVNKEMEKAKSQYETLIRDTLQNKKSSDLSVALDSLYDKVESVTTKQAHTDDWPGVVGNVGLTLAAISAIGGGVAGYKWRKSRQKDNVLEKAKQKRLREAYSTRPFAMYAYPESK